MSILVLSRNVAMEVAFKAFLIAMFVFSNGLVAEQAYEIISKRHSYLHPGADPCNPKVGCTLEWALQMAVQHNGWPQEAADELIKKVGTEAGEPYIVYQGQEFWMTGGREVPKYYTNSIASFDKDRTESSVLWYVNVGTRRYYLIKVHICGNWAGWDSEYTIPIEEGHGNIPFGPVPTGACPPN